MRRNRNLPADTSVLSQIGSIISEASRNAGFNEEEMGEILLAVDEACTNTIVHGLKNDPLKTFDLEVISDKGIVEILIREDGEPFDPTNVAIPDLYLAAEDRPIGGLGVFIMRKLMDLIEYTIDRDGIKTLKMVKQKSQT